jgi:hypothetical protein
VTATGARRGEVKHAGRIRRLFTRCLRPAGAGGGGSNKECLNRHAPPCHLLASSPSGPPSLRFISFWPSVLIPLRALPLLLSVARFPPLHEITVLVTFHLPSDRHTTPQMLNESQYSVYFPQSSSSKIRYVLANYLDIDEKMIKLFKRLNSRWVCIRQNFPLCVVAEHGCGLLNVDGDDEGDKKG